MKNMLQVLSFDLIGKALLALVGALLIRYMSQVEYASYSVAYALMLVFIQLCSGCLSRVYVVGFERFQLQNDPGVLTRLQLALLFIGAPVLVITLGIHQPLTWICAGAMILGCGSELIKSRFQQAMRFAKFSSVEFLRAALVCAGVAAVVSFNGFHPSAPAVLSLQLVSFGLVLCLHRLPALDLFNRVAWLATARFGRTLWNSSYRYLFVYFMILALFGQIDLLVLRYAGTQYQLATYAAAYRYYNVLLLALAAVNSVLLPAAQRVSTWAQTVELRRQHKAALMLFVPFVFIAILAAGVVMPAVDGGRYPESPAVFRVLAVSSLVSFVLSPELNLVLRYEDFRFLAVAAAVALIVGPLLNLLLIPRFGPIGTAYSVLISFAALNGAGFWRASRYRDASLMAVAA